MYHQMLQIYLPTIHSIHHKYHNLQFHNQPYINSSTSIAEPVKPFNGLDHNYTPEEYLQHIEARVTFSLGLQPTSDHEYKFWHARRMAFIQCSLTGTAWYMNTLTRESKSHTIPFLNITISHFLKNGCPFLYLTA